MRQIKAQARGSFPALAAAVLGVCWHWGRMWENLQLCPSGGSEEETSSVPRGAEGEAHRVPHSGAVLLAHRFPGSAGHLPALLPAAPCCSEVWAWAGLWDVHGSLRRSEGCSNLPGLVPCARSSELTGGVPGATCAPHRQGHGAGNRESPRVSWGQIPAVLVSAPKSYTQSTARCLVATGAIWGGCVVMASTGLNHA